MHFPSLRFRLGLSLPTCTTQESKPLNFTPQACSSGEDKRPYHFEVSESYVGESKQDVCLLLTQEPNPHLCCPDLRGLDGHLPFTLADDKKTKIRDRKSRVLPSADLSVALFEPAVTPAVRGLNWVQM